MAAPRRFRWGIVALVVVMVGLIAWLWIMTHPAPKPAKSPSVPVSTAKATIQDVPVVVSALGAAQAWQAVTINAQVTGKLKYVAAEGSDVRAGALLAEIDCSVYQAALAQASGTLHKDQAVLAEAQIDLKRYQTLVAQDSISKQQAEDQEQLVKQDEGVVQTDQGSVAAAKVNVGYCRITAPMAGRVGVRLIDPGNVITVAGTTGIVTLNQVTPIAVTFTVPEGDFQRLSMASGGFTKPLATLALSQETGQQLGAGELTVSDNHVDPATGSVAMKAKFPNDSRQLWPGQFLDVRLTLQSLQNAVTVPAQAVNQGPNGPYVYIVGPGSKALLKPVQVATTQDNLAVIKSGLKGGETVVTDGQMTLRPNLSVAVRGAGGGGAAGGKSASKKPAA
jgi:multidrug efflux system membrane fusion protein